MPYGDHHPATIRHARFPIPDLGVIDDAGYDAILAHIDHEIGAGGRVYVHCWGGVGRTSTVIACVLGSAGASLDDSLDRYYARAHVRATATSWKPTHCTTSSTNGSRAPADRRTRTRPRSHGESPSDPGLLIDIATRTSSAPPITSEGRHLSRFASAGSGGPSSGSWFSAGSRCPDMSTKADQSSHS